jgi:hypothetical protein
MPAMTALQLCNRRPNVAGAARSYAVIVLLRNAFEITSATYSLS